MFSNVTGERSRCGEAPSPPDGSLPHPPATASATQSPSALISPPSPGRGPAGLEPARAGRAAAARALGVEVALAVGRVGALAAVALRAVSAAVGVEAALAARAVRAAAAVALGACIVEKHLRLDRELTTPDSFFSLDPIEFAQLVETIRAVEESLGSISYATAADAGVGLVAPRPRQAATHARFLPSVCGRFCRLSGSVSG